MAITERANIFTIAQYGSYETFIKESSDKDINKKSESGSSLLHCAIVGRNYDIALYLIQRNIDVNMRNPDDQTALHLICFYPNLEVATAIIEKGGDIDIRDRYGNNALWYAVFNCKGKYYDMVELFIKYKPDISTKNNAGRSPLDFALQVNNERLINILQT